MGIYNIRFAWQYMICISGLERVKRNISLDIVHNKVDAIEIETHILYTDIDISLKL